MRCHENHERTKRSTMSVTARLVIAVAFAFVARPGVTTKRRDGTMLDVVVAGRLTIRDTTQPVTAPVRVELRGRELTANGRFAIKQTAFGIKPISIGGVVAVKDALDIAFSITARR